MKTLGKLLAIAAACVAVFSLLYIVDHWGEDDDKIPVAPPGQHYCTNGQQLGLCYDEPAHEWR